MQSAGAALYCHLWPFWPHNIFPNYLTKGMILGEIIIEHKMCDLIFSTAFVLELQMSLILRRIWLDIIIIYVGLRVQCPLFCKILMELESSRQIFEKYSDMNFHKNPCSGNRVVPYGRTNMKLFGAFRNFADARDTWMQSPSQDDERYGTAYVLGRCDAHRPTRPSVAAHLSFLTIRRLATFLLLTNGRLRSSWGRTG